MSRKPKLHLICNAHLDPVWLWEWQEGAAEAMATFRSAADLCEEFDGFVFNHNEVILYEWIEEYEPELFKRIQRLVAEGRWHIMGGWYLQPDCNMPSGESMVRQMLVGRRYFSAKFGVRPTTAINFDPFGHSRGLVQLLVKAGFDAYLICRPMPDIFSLESDLFTWVGIEQSEVTVFRSPTYYLSGLGEVHNKYKEFLEKFYDKAGPVKQMLWGVGNHGGGPSRIDLRSLARIMREDKEKMEIVHSTPEKYFAEARRAQPVLPKIERGLIPFAVGCYTSQIRVKQKHRELENELFATEKMCTTASAQGLMEYPRAELLEAQRDLLTAEFHDILPGSSIQPAEDMSIRLMDHGLEILSRIKARAYFALASGQKRASNDLIPVLVYNPQAHDVDAIVEAEFQMPNGSLPDKYSDIVVMQRGKDVPTQVEQEISNLPYDWRKRVVFPAKLKAGEMARFDCRIIKDSPFPVFKAAEKNGRFTFRSEELDVVINAETGLLDRYRVHGVDYLSRNAFQPLCMEDLVDSWGMTVEGFKKIEGAFTLLSPEESAELSGVKVKKLPAVRGG